MKRYLILSGIVAAVLLLLLFVWLRGGRNVSTPENSELPQKTRAVGDSSNRSDRAATEAEPRQMVTAQVAVATNQDDEFLQLVRRGDEAGNIPVVFYGVVMDQDNNALQNVTVDLVVIEEWSEPLPQGRKKTTPLQKQTGADGRFEVSGLRGKYVAVSLLTKAGYEEDFPAQGQWLRRYGAQSGSLNEPIVFRLWSTNLHEPLVTGDKSFVIVPDGRRYAIDVIKGTIAEGEAGDLLLWIKRPESVRRAERFDWSCELAVPAGGLLESQNQAMFISPESGYTNLFAYQEQANSNGSGSLQDRRFYIRLRNGQMYGRIVISLYPNYGPPGMIRLSYAVNPSGSRLLR